MNLRLYYGSTTLAHLHYLQTNRKANPGGIFFHTQSSLLSLSSIVDCVHLFSDFGQRFNLLSYYQSICQTHDFSGYLALSNRFQDRFIDYAYKYKINPAYIQPSKERVQSFLKSLPVSSYSVTSHYAPYGAVYQFNWRDAKYADCRNLPNYFYLIYDLIALKTPQYISENSDVPKYLTGLLASILPRHNIIVSSATVKVDILTFFPHIKEHQIHVVPLASDKNRFKSKTKNLSLGSCLTNLSIPNQPYFLCTSTLEPRKNMLSVISAFQQFCAVNPESNANLILVGSKGWAGEGERIAKAVKESKGRIFVTGFIEDSTLSLLYSNCLAFIFPSFDEGFGMPIVEAMSCGAPVITSNISSMWEIGQDYSIGVNPHSVPEILNAMILMSKPEQSSYYKSRALVRSADFSWSKHAESLHDLYIRSLRG